MDPEVLRLLLAHRYVAVEASAGKKWQTAPSKGLEEAENSIRSFLHHDCLRSTKIQGIINGYCWSNARMQLVPSNLHCTVHASAHSSDGSPRSNQTKFDMLLGSQHTESTVTIWPKSRMHQSDHQRCWGSTTGLETIHNCRFAAQFGAHGSMACTASAAQATQAP